MGVYTPRQAPPSNQGPGHPTSSPPYLGHSLALARVAVFAMWALLPPPFTKFPTKQSPYLVYAPSAPLGLNYLTRPDGWRQGLQSSSGLSWGEMVREGVAIKSLQFRDRKQSVPKLRSIRTPPHSPPDVKPQTHWSLPGLKALSRTKGTKAIGLLSPLKAGNHSGGNTSQPSPCPFQ